MQSHKRWMKCAAASVEFDLNGFEKRHRKYLANWFSSKQNMKTIQDEYEFPLVNVHNYMFVW